MIRPYRCCRRRMAVSGSLSQQAEVLVWAAASLAPLP
jgi:hypothetical protein